jgi:coproporphyrinogen III oxidase-like Fe-S oxidoreductase
MMGLRLKGGIPRATFLRIFDAEPEVLLPRERLDQLRNNGLIVLDETRLTVTEAGLSRLDGLLAYLFG